MARFEKIECFSSFRLSMLDYFSKYKDETKRKKSTISHRLSLLLSHHFPPSYTIEIDYNGADILVLNEKKESILAIFWSNTYLTEKEKERAQKYHVEYSPMLTLAFSLLEEKDYILVYRFEDDYLEYLHINKIDFSEYLLKRCLIGENNGKNEPTLFSKKKRISH